MTMTVTANGAATATAHEPISNDAAADIVAGMPYMVDIELTGTAAILFHRWSNEAVLAKASAAKNSAAKKSDNLESYVHRADDGTVALPGEYVRQAVIQAARFRQDPRSPRKSAMDLYKAGVVSLTEFASLGRDTWEYVDARRVMVQRQGVTRQRPAFNAGWQAALTFQVLTPEYIRPADLLDVLANAGRLIGVGDFRPTYGRFQVTRFAVREA